MESENNVIVLKPGESMHDYKGSKKSVVTNNADADKAPAAKVDAKLDGVKKKQ